MRKIWGLIGLIDAGSGDRLRSAVLLSSACYGLLILYYCYIFILGLYFYAFLLKGMQYYYAEGIVHINLLMRWY